MSVNKIEFFKIMREQPVHEDARIDEVTNTNGTYTIRLNNPCNPNAALTNHRSWNNAQKAAAKYALWLEEFRTIEAAHAEALEMNEVHDYVARTKDMSVDEIIAESNAVIANAAVMAQRAVMESDCLPALVEACHAEALEIDYCVEAVKEGGGYLGGYVVQNKDASFQVLRERTTTGNPLKATYFSEDDYQQGRMKQFCFNGEIPVRLGEAVLAVAELAK